MSRAVNAVVFDLGGVLLDWDPRYLYRQLMAHDEVDDFLDEIDFASWNRVQDSTSRPWALAVEELVAQHPHRRDLIAAYRQRFRESIAGPIPGTVDILRELHQRKVRLFALTNWSAETFAETRGEFDFLGLFEGIVVSGEEEIAKPDPRVFRLVLDRYQLAADATVLVDDSAANVAAAESVGLVALRFRDADRLREDLVSLGLLS